MKLPEKVVKAAIGVGAGVLANELIEKMSKEVSDKVAEKAKEMFSSDDFKNKYENLRKVSLSTESNIKSFENAIFEAKNMKKHYQFDLDSINAKNPANLPKYKVTRIKFGKSENLLTSLRNEADDRIVKEATIVHESKNESEFFNPYPKINTDLINCNSENEFNKILLDINKYYLKDFRPEKSSI